MSEVLARVTSRAVEGPRGPDVLHRIKVRHEWLADGEVVELELPRNLSCAACGGGGCDTCGRSGAITLRRRDEPAEVVEVTLPARKPGDEMPDSRGLTLRIPEQGGLPEAGTDLPRGVLLLTLIPSAEPDPLVRLVRGGASDGARARGDETARGDDVERGGRRLSPTVLAVALVLLLWLLLLIWLRLSGRG